MKNLHGQFSFRKVLWVDRNGGNHHHLPLKLFFMSVPKNHQIWGSSIKSKRERIDASVRNYWFNFQSYWVLMGLRKMVSIIWKWGNDISRYYRTSVMETVLVQQCSLALIKPHLFCYYRLQISDYILPLKNLLSKPPKNFTDYFKSTQSEFCKNYSMVFSLNIFFVFLLTICLQLKEYFLVLNFTLKTLSMLFMRHPSISAVLF